MKPIPLFVTRLTAMVSAKKAFRASAPGNSDPSAALPGGALFFGLPVNIYHA
jgi:hypothetical protein